MKEKQNLYQGVSCAAWGCVFLYFNINLGALNILPEFVGYLLFLASISLLKEEMRDMALLRPLTIVLAVWYGIQWGMKCLEIPMGQVFLILSLIAGVAELYFNFQFFTDFAAIAVKYQQPEDTLDKEFIKWRTVQTVLLTVITVMSFWCEIDEESWMLTVLSVLMILGLVAGICLMATLFSLRSRLKTE